MKHILAHIRPRALRMRRPLQLFRRGARSHVHVFPIGLEVLTVNYDDFKSTVHYKAVLYGDCNAV
jgi:hypothetical protein